MPAAPHRTHRTRYTSINGKQAAWQMIGSRIEILALTVTGGARPSGTVAFDNHISHDLCWARERFGNFADLWDAIRTEYWQLLLRYDAYGI